MDGRIDKNDGDRINLFDLSQKFQNLQVKLLSAGIHFFHRHIRNDDAVERRMSGNDSFRLFCETQYHSKKELNQIFSDSVHDSSPMHVCSFILSILHQGIFSVAAFIVSVIYLSRFKEASQITLHACTWRPLFLTTLLVADKMWEDKPVRNSSLAKLFPVLSNTELNNMENKLLRQVQYNVVIKPDLFSSFCDKLLGEQVNPDIIKSVKRSDYAAVIAQETSNVLTTDSGHPMTQFDPSRQEEYKNGNIDDRSSMWGNNNYNLQKPQKHAPRHFTPDLQGLTTAIQSFAIGRPTIGLQGGKNFFNSNMMQLGQGLAQGENDTIRSRSTGPPGAERRYGLNRVQIGYPSAQGAQGAAQGGAQADSDRSNRTRSGSAGPPGTDKRSVNQIARLNGQPSVDRRSQSMDPLAKGSSIPQSQGQQISFFQQQLRQNQQMAQRTIQAQQQAQKQAQQQAQAEGDETKGSGIAPAYNSPTPAAKPQQQQANHFFGGMAPKISLMGPTPLRRSLPAKPGQYVQAANPSPTKQSSPRTEDLHHGLTAASRRQENGAGGPVNTTSAEAQAHQGGKHHHQEPQMGQGTSLLYHGNQTSMLQRPMTMFQPNSRSSSIPRQQQVQGGQVQGGQVVGPQRIGTGIPNGGIGQVMTTTQRASSVPRVVGTGGGAVSSQVAAASAAHHSTQQRANSTSTGQNQHSTQRRVNSPSTAATNQAPHSATQQRVNSPSMLGMLSVQTAGVRGYSPVASPTTQSSVGLQPASQRRTGSPMGIQLHTPSLKGPNIGGGNMLGGIGSATRGRSPGPQGMAPGSQGMATHGGPRIASPGLSVNAAGPVTGRNTVRMFANGRA